MCSLAFSVRKLGFQFRALTATIFAGVLRFDLFSRKAISFGNFASKKIVSTKFSKTRNWGVFVHIHYEEFVDFFVSQLRDFPEDATFFFSVTSEGLRDSLAEQLRKDKRLAEIRVVPNRGRNFAPLLVEYSREISKFDYVLHVHSKRSSHAGNKIGPSWAKSLFENLLTFESLVTADRLLQENPSVGLIYPDMGKTFRRINHYWGANKRALLKSKFYSATSVEPLWKLPLAYPIGGMFFARTAALNELLEFEWKYEMFPEENGQLDGTLQHAIERYVGFVATHNGYEHGIFTEISGNFLTFKNIDAIGSPK
jgi:lipopolysaccharide biosynthesis protein